MKKTALSKRIQTVKNALTSRTSGKRYLKPMKSVANWARTAKSKRIGALRDFLTEKLNRVGRKSLLTAAQKVTLDKFLKLCHLTDEIVDNTQLGDMVRQLLILNGLDKDVSEQQFSKMVRNQVRSYKRSSSADISFENIKVVSAVAALAPYLTRCMAGARSSTKRSLPERAHLAVA